MSGISLFGQYGPVLAAVLTGIALIGGTFLGTSTQKTAQKEQARVSRLLEGYDRYVAALRHVSHAQGELIKGGATKENLQRWGLVVIDASIAHTSMIIRGSPKRTLDAARLLEELISNSDFTTGDPKKVQAAADRVTDAREDLLDLMREDIGSARRK